MFDFKKTSIYFFQYFRKSARKSKRIGRLLKGLYVCFKLSALWNQIFTWLKPIQTKNHFVILEFLYTHNEVAYFRSSHRRCSVRKGVLKNSQNSQENTCARASFLIKLQASAWIPLAKWLSVPLRTKWLWVRITLLSLKLQYRGCFDQGVPWHSGKL